MPVSEPDPVLSALRMDSSELAFWAFRYFLGRQTATACLFAKDLAKAWPHLEADDRAMIRKELERAFWEDDEARVEAMAENRPLGHDMDREAWDEVRAAWRELEEDEQ